MILNLVPPIRTPILTVSRLVSAQWERWFAAVVDALPRPLFEYAQADLAGLAAKLTRADAGREVWVTDFRHKLRWTGGAWEFAIGDGPGGYVAAFAVDPEPATGWQLCDGTETTYLKADGTTGDYTPPDLIGTGSGAYLKLGDTVSGPNAATAPGFTGAAAAPTGISATAGTPSATQIVQSGAGVAVAGATHIHAISITDPQHTHSGGTVDDAGEPRNVVLHPWFRR